MLIKNPILRRLMPIYLAFFFKGLIFWYAIEKLFMTDIGFTPSSIATMVVVMGVTGLLLEIPFGILADRWSRKGVLILSVVALSASTLAFGLSETVLQYIISSIFFGMYMAMFSGSVDSIVYDTLLEENDSRDGYEKYYGYTNLIMSVTLVLGSLAGGLIATAISLQATYFLTLPSMAIAIIILLKLREPKLHKQHPDTKVIKHIRDTFSVLRHNGNVAWIILMLICSGILLEILYEMDQLWPIALAMPLVWYGPVNALFLAGYGLGGPLADLVIRKKLYISILGILLILCVSVLSIQNIIVVVAALSIGIILFQAVYTIGLGKLHDELPSKYRSGGASSVSSIVNVAMIPVILYFGFLADNFSVFTASYLMIPISMICVGALFVIFKHKISLKCLSPSHIYRSRPFGRDTL